MVTSQNTMPHVTFVTGILLVFCKQTNVKHYFLHTDCEGRGLDYPRSVKCSPHLEVAVQPCGLGDISLNKIKKFEKSH